MLRLFIFSFTPNIPVIINSTNKGLREVTNQANGKDSIMTFYYVWIGTISDAGNIYSKLGSYVHDFII